MRDDAAITNASHLHSGRGPRNVDGRNVQSEHMQITCSSRPVGVIQLPEVLNAESKQLLLRQLEACLETTRPLLVLDCSRAVQMDEPLVYMLLLCLEEAIKHNGDAWLAGVSPGGRTLLESTGVVRLFRIFDSKDDAMSTLHRAPTNAAPGYGAVQGAPEESPERRAADSGS